jgi:hypothetical protein
MKKVESQLGIFAAPISKVQVTERLCSLNPKGLNDTFIFSVSWKGWYVYGWRSSIGKQCFCEVWLGDLEWGSPHHQMRIFLTGNLIKDAIISLDINQLKTGNQLSLYTPYNSTMSYFPSSCNDSADLITPSSSNVPKE